MYGIKFDEITDEIMSGLKRLYQGTEYIAFGIKMTENTILELMNVKMDAVTIMKRDFTC